MVLFHPENHDPEEPTINPLRKVKATIAIIVLMTLSGTGLARGAEAKQDAKAPPTEKKASESPSFKNINVPEFEKLRADKKNVVLDVRTAKEFEAGHVPGAVNIDWSGPDFEKKVGALDKGKAYLVHCAAGVRSAKASAAMSKLNFKHLYNLEGGFKAWEKAGHQGEKK